MTEEFNITLQINRLGIVISYSYKEENLAMACLVDNFISLNYDGSLEFINDYKVNINSKVNF